MTTTTTKPRQATLNMRWAGRGDIIRIYVNVGRDSIGYLERRIETQARSAASAYDRHRIAKGDLDELVSDTVTVHGLTEEQVAAVDAAVGYDDAKAIDDSGVDRWLRWRGKCRGGIYRNARHKASVAKFRVALS